MVTPVPAASSRATLSRLVAAATWPERTSASASAFRLVNCKERKQPPASRTANMAAWDVYAVKPAIAAIESETSAAFAVNIARNRKPPSTLVRKVCTHSIEPPIKTPIAARKMLRAPNLSAIQPDIGMKHKSAHATMEATRKEEERIRARTRINRGQTEVWSLQRDAYRAQQRASARCARPVRDKAQETSGRAHRDRFSSVQSTPQSLESIDAVPARCRSVIHPDVEP